MRQRRGLSLEIAEIGAKWSINRLIFMKTSIKRWSDSEIEILKTWYSKISVPYLMENYLPNRTVDAIQLKAAKLGLRSTYPNNRTIILQICVQCNKEYEGKFENGSKYCSAACKTDAYRKSHCDELSFVKKQREYIKKSRQLKPQTENNKKWYQAHPLVIKAKNSRRRALGDIEPSLIQQIFDYYNNQCVYCGIKNKKLTLEHLLPIKRGGTNDPYNLAPACKTCNLSKSKKNLIEYLIYSREK